MALSDWFLTQELSFALGISILFGRLGTTMNYWITPLIAEKSLGISFLIGLVLWFISCLFTYWFIIINKRLQNQNKINYLYRNNYSERFSWTDIWSLDRKFWLTCFILWFIYIGVFCFASIDEFFETKFNIQNQNINTVEVVMNFIPWVLAPIFGIILDKYGYKIVATIFASILIMISHIFFMWFSIPKDSGESYWWILPICLLGISYSIFVVALWPLIPLVVKPSAIGTAFGISSSITNLGTAFGTFLSQVIVSNSDNGHFLWANFFFLICGFISASLSAVLYYFDNKYIKMNNTKKLLDDIHKETNTSGISI